MASVGFVGLGTMGGSMAVHLVLSHADVWVWNRTAARAAGLVEIGARAAGTLNELAEQCDVVFLCVGTSDDVREVLAKARPAAKAGTLFVDHSTISPAVAEELHDELAQEGLKFLDAPITGGSMGAQAGTLTIFCGGEEESFRQAEPFMRSYGKTVELVGGPGAGQLTKMANQIAVGGALIGMAESLAFAKRAGLDAERTRRLLAGGAAGSWALDNYGPRALQANWEPGFAIQHQRKDFGYVFEVAEKLGIPVPATELVDRLLAEIDDPREATTALYRLMLERQR